MEVKKGFTITVWLPISVKEAIAETEQKPHLAITQSDEDTVYYVNGEHVITEKNIYQKDSNL
jgi:hypothetical protein